MREEKEEIDGRRYRSSGSLDFNPVYLSRIQDDRRREKGSVNYYGTYEYPLRGDTYEEVRQICGEDGFHVANHPKCLNMARGFYWFSGTKYKIHVDDIAAFALRAEISIVITRSVS